MGLECHLSQTDILQSRTISQCVEIIFKVPIIVRLFFLQIWFFYFEYCLNMDVSWISTEIRDLKIGRLLQKGFKLIALYKMIWSKHKFEDFNMKYAGKAERNKIECLTQFGLFHNLFFIFIYFLISSYSF